MLLPVLCLQVWDNAYPTTCVCLRAYRTSDYFAFADVYLSYFDIGLGLPRKFHTMALLILSSHTFFQSALLLSSLYRITTWATLFTLSVYCYFGLVLHLLWRLSTMWAIVSCALLCVIAGCWEAYSCSALLSMLFNAHVPECSFLSCCKTLGASSLCRLSFRNYAV